MARGQEVSGDSDVIWSHIRARYVHENYMYGYPVYFEFIDK